MIFGFTFQGVRAQAPHNITLTWVNGTGGGAPTSYKILRSTTSGAEVQIATVPAPALTYVDTAGVGGTTYFYKIVASNSAGDAPASSEVSATFLLDKPTAVASVAATAN
jgi:hypothetical protein